MLVNGAIRECRPAPDQIVHPLGAVLKTSDKTRARALAGIELMDQRTLGTANERLLDKELPKRVKVTLDCTATG